MKHTIKSLLCFMLALLLTVSCMATALAAGKTVKQYGKVTGDIASGNYYGGVTVIGDSVTRGCGASFDPENPDEYWDHFLSEYYDLTHRVVEGSYAVQLAQAVGATCIDKITGAAIDDDDNVSVVSVDDVLADAQAGNSFWPITGPGLTLSMIMEYMGIDDNDYDGDAAYKSEGPGTYSAMLEPLYFTEDTKYGKTPAEQILETSSLIVLELGMSDVFSRSASYIGNIFGDDADVAEGVKLVLAEMYDGYSYWSKYYPVFIQYIREMNPNAKIVLLGNYNSFFGVVPSEDSVLPVGNAVSALTELMNQKVKQWAKQFGCTYVDIANVELTSETVNELALSDFMGLDHYGFMLNTHPSVAGYSYITRQIVNALPAEDGSITFPSANVMVDLGSVTNVRSVTLDGRVRSPITYSFDADTHRLTVKNLSLRSNTLTVTYTTASGKVGMANYVLTRSAGNYMARRIYCTNDLYTTAAKAVKSVVSLPSRLLALVCK